MAETLYTDQHEWVRVSGSEATAGISTYAAEQLGDIVYVELPEIGRRVKQGEEVAVVESVKAASEVYAPVDGEVIAVNDALGASPETVNQDAEGEGWFFKLKLAGSPNTQKLMNAVAYQKHLKELA